MNARIRARSVRLIGVDGQQVGIVSLEEALLQARQAGLDLVEVSRGAEPPVCKILDYGKYQYEQAKREKESRKNQRKVEMKGVRIGFRTDDHDLLLKRKRTEQFLAEGDKVRVEIYLRGREKAHGALAHERLSRFFASLATPHTFEEPIAKSPRGFAAIIVLKKE